MVTGSASGAGWLFSGLPLPPPFAAGSGWAAAPSAGASSSAGGAAPPLAQSSSNSTRHLPSSFCSSCSLARKRAPGAAAEARDGLGGAAHRRVLAGSIDAAQALDQLLDDRRRQGLAGLLLPDHEAAAGVVARPARVALAVLDHVAAADRAGAEVGPLDLHVLELVELLDRVRRELGDVLHEAGAALVAVLDPPEPVLPVAGEPGRGQRVLAEQADHLDALLGGRAGRGPRARCSRPRSGAR